MSVPSLNGYHNYCAPSKLLKSGGVVAYVKNGLSVISEDIACHSTDFETLSLYCSSTNTKFVIVYRHPSTSFDVFVKWLYTTFSSHKFNSGDAVFIGDINLDLFGTSNKVSDYLNLLNSFGYSQLVSFPTRGESLLDHVIVSDNIKESVNTIRDDNPITDHTAIINIFHRTIINQPGNSSINTRKPFSTGKIMKFREDVLNVDWDTIKNCDQNIFFNKFHSTIFDIFDKNFPLKKFHKKDYKSPWMNRRLLKLISHKRNLYNKWKTDNSMQAQNIFKSFARKTAYEIYSAKRHYYQQLLTKTTSSSDKWRIINRLSNRSDKKTNVEEIIIDNSLTSDGQIICDAFTKKYRKVFSNDHRSPVPASSRQSNFTFSIFEVSSTEVESAILSLRNSCSCQDNDIPIIIWKTIADIICNVLRDLINNSFTTGVVPNLLKIAKVMPIYKKNCRTDINNYRPVSILPVLSKVYEKLFYNRLRNFCDKFAVLPATQFGFRTNSSTTMAAIQALHYINTQCNYQLKTAGVFLDMSQAFDKVNHETLLRKLYNIGLRGLGHKWLTSFMSNRFFYLSVNSNVSQPQPIKTGVPQGSILSPLLFNIYIAELPDNVPFSSIQYADDTTLIITGDTELDLLNNIKLAFDSTHTFLRSLNLSLNATKTDIVRFDTDKQIEVTLDGIPIVSKTNTKFLGFDIDGPMKMNSMVSATIKKLCSLFPLVYNLRMLLPDNAKRLLFFAYIYSHISYIATFLPLCSQALINKLNSYYKKLTKCLFIASRRDSWTTLRQLHCIPNVSDIIYSRSCSQVSFILFSNHLLSTNQIFSTSARTLNIHLLRHDHIKNSIHNKLAIIWNEQSSDQKESRRRKALRKLK